MKLIMKVLQINAVYGHGSTGTIVRNLELMCEQIGIDCYVASPDPTVRQAKRGYVIGNSLDHKLHAALSRINGKQGYFSRIPTYFLCRYIDSIMPDVVHIHNVHSNYLHFNHLLRHLAKRHIRTVITLHDCWPYTGGCFHYASVGCGRWKSTCGKCPKKMLDTPAYLGDCSSNILADRKEYILAIPQLVINGVSEWISDECKKSVLGKANITTIRNGINLELFKPTEIPLQSIKLLELKKRIEGKRVILAPASKWLLPINSEVLNYFVDHLSGNDVLLLYGSSHYSHQLSSNVLTYGFVHSQREMAALYTMADVLVNCTREESLSLVNVECQACGTPVVTFDATAPKETVDNINSFSVRVGDAVALFQKTEWVLNHSTQETALGCQRFVAQHFEMTENYRKYIELYSDKNFW